jgi:leader peptidase (prepilin peptidase)/N-methyltransferase
MNPLLIWFVAAFVLGLLAGTLINTCALRLPYEKSLLWPGPRCGHCLQKIRLLDCLPLIGYLRLLGRCRSCGRRIPLSYPIVEFATAALFVGLAAVVTLELPGIERRWPVGLPQAPGAALVIFVHHAVLLSLLLLTSLCDLEDMEIPLTVTVWGTVIGLVFATLFPWPYPGTVDPRVPGLGALRPPYPGVYAWPVWYPLPAWMPAGSPQLGLATGVAGALAGMIMLRGVRFLFGLGRGIEGMGVGDADLMMMAGAFVGWQPVVLAFFLAIIPGLIFAIGQLIFRGTQALPFGPSLALGVVLAVLGWPVLGGHFLPVMFDPVFLGLMAGSGSVGFFFLAFVLRLVRGGAGPTVAGS